MNQAHYEILEELLDDEIASVGRYLSSEIASKNFMLDLGLSTDNVDLTITRLSAKLELLNETLGHLIDWSNN